MTPRLPRSTRHTCLAFAFLSLFGADSAFANAPTVTFDMPGLPAVVAPGETHVLNLRYAVSGNNLENATVSIDLPHGVLPTGAGHDASWVGGCTPDGETPWVTGYLDWRCSWTAASLQVPQGGVSGQIPLTVKFARYAFGNNETTAFAPVFNANWNDGGTMRAITPIAVNASATIQGNVDLQWQNWMQVSDWSYAYVDLGGGETGLIVEMQIGVANNGTTRVDAGASLHVELPPGMLYAGFTNVGHPVVLISDTDVGDPGPAVFEVETTIGRTYANPQTTPDGNGQYAYNIGENSLHWFYVRALVTCDAIPLAATDIVRTSLVGIAPGVSANQPGQLAMNNIEPGWNLIQAETQFACGLPVRTNLGRSSSSAASQYFSLQATIQPPTGEVPVREAYACTTIPSDIKALSFSHYMPWASGIGNPRDHGFDFFYCSLPAITGTFDRATFESNWRNSGSCWSFDEQSLNVPEDRRATHMILHAPAAWTWPGELGATVWAPVTATANVNVDRCMAGAQATSFAVQTYVSARVNGAVQTANQTMVVDSPVLSVPAWYNTANPLTATRGQTQRLSFATAVQGDTAPLLNPVITMPVPPGVSVLEITPANWNDARCTTAPIQWEVVDGILTIRAGTANEPWYSDPNCQQNNCRQGGYLYFDMRVAFDAFHPFVNGQPVAFNVALTGANVNPNSWSGPTALYSVVVTMQVPGEKRLVLGPVCDANNRTGLRTRFVNSGGVPLSNVTVTVPLPRVADGSGSEVSPRLHAAATTLGTVECSNDGNDFSHGCGASTTHVRVQLADLQPYQSGDLDLIFAPDAAFPLGAIVRHRAQMTSTELLPINAPPGPPARWNRCPGTIVLNAWFDANANGTRDPDESGLGNWVLRFTDLTAQAAGQNLVFDFVIPPGGRVETDLPPGQFGLEVVPVAPADANATWVNVVNVPDSIAISTGLATTLDVAVSCTCNDNDSCTTDSCVVGGYCAFALNTSTPGCVAECGNGIEERGESCDNGSTGNWEMGCYGCKCDFGYESDPESNLCRPICGDGIVAWPEECDDKGESDLCTADCQQKCGNGVRDAGEQCDTGLETDLVGGCLECRCSFAGWVFDETADACVPRCGDNLVMGGETCDDGNTVGGDGCSATCQVESNWACEQPDYTGCLPAEFCQGELPAWCTISDPETPGGSPNDWCGVIFGNRGNSEFCAIGDLRCDDFAEECPDFDPERGGDSDELCFWRSVFCGFCPTMGPSECVVVCVPTIEVCNGRDDDCDGRIDFSAEGASSSVCSPVETDILTHPPILTGQTSATFTYQNPADPENTDFECALDDGPWFECDGGTWSTTGLSPGQHVFRVRSLRGDGAVDDTPAFHNWTIDPTVPDTLITSAPDNPSGSTTATFVFDSNLPVVEDYLCALVDGSATPAVDAWEDCDETTVFTGLEDGQYTVWVYAVTPAGVPDPTPASHTFVVDLSQPETVITSGPAISTTSGEATFTYADPDDPSITTFMCRFNDTAWVACDGGTTAFSDLPEGDHTLSVYAINGLGVADASPATWAWTVDTTAPETTIVTGPADPSQTGSGAFTFSSNEPGSSFFCVIVAAGQTPDADDYEPCNATTPFTGLEDGTWTMWVYAEDPAGNVDTTPATWTWTVDSTLPETVITSGPGRETPVGDDATFAFESPNGGENTGFDCRIDGGPWVACDDGTMTFTDLAPGEHVFEVRACDRVREVCDPTPATSTWTVSDSPCPDDDVAPVLSCTENVTVECVGGTATVDVATFEPDATDACEPVAIIAIEPDVYVVGDNPVVFTGTDGNGNEASCATAVKVVDTAPPALTCPADITVTTAPTFCGAVVDFPPRLATDVCHGAAVVTANIPESFRLGATIVTFTASDASGLTTSCTTTVTVTPGPNADAVCVDPDDGLIAQGGGCAGGGAVSWLALLAAVAGLGLCRRRIA